MPRVSESFDPAAVEWRHVTDLSNAEFKVDFEYSLLGYDLETSRLDMLLRYGKGGGHCRRHRHVAATATLVLEGEQFVTDLLPDGATSKTVHRTKGAYALSAADADPHNECGGEDGGTVLLSMHARADGVLFEYFDDNMENGWTLSIQQYVDAWNKGTAYGEAPAAQATAAE
jgi:hypothetical protein